MFQSCPCVEPFAPVTTISIGTSGTVAEAGPEETARIVATVADSLIAVGALAVASTLLREFPAAAQAGTHRCTAGCTGSVRGPTD